MVEAAVLVSRPFIRISLELVGKGQDSFILNLHKTWSIRAVIGVKLVNFLAEGLERLPSCHSPVLAIFRPLSDHMSSYLFLFLVFSSRANNVSSTFMYLVAL